MPNKTSFIVLALLLTLIPRAHAQAPEDLSRHWAGEWLVEGTLFRIGVEVEGDTMTIRQIESLGFLWTSGNGRIDGNVATVEVEYAGVTGMIQAELVGPSTAVAFAATCLPDFMVVCLLARDQQAVFLKVAAD